MEWEADERGRKVCAECKTQTCVHTHPDEEYACLVCGTINFGLAYWCETCGAYPETEKPRWDLERVLGIVLKERAELTRERDELIQALRDVTAFYANVGDMNEARAKAESLLKRYEVRDEG